MGLFKSFRHGQSVSPTPNAGQGANDRHGYVVPAGPPPGRSPVTGQDKKPPPGLPPSYNASIQSNRDKSSQAEQQPTHDWTSVPDTALLPPPPSIINTVSPTGNAEESDAIRAHEWCERYPLTVPHRPTPAQANAVRDGAIILQKPSEYKGSLDSYGPGLWRGSTSDGSGDCSILSTMPLYFAEIDNPLKTGTERTIYFEIKILSFGSRTYSGESSLAIGYCAVPYPTWRMPGWERGSFAVHSDDGRRYISDTDGGIDFTTSLKPGQTVGLGVRFSVPPHKDKDPAAAPQCDPDGEAFFTRDGKRSGGWDIHEETDTSNEYGTLGIDGRYDLFGSIGVYGSVGFEAVFDPRHWLFRP